MASLYANDSFYKKERSEFLNYRDDVREKMYYARGRCEELANCDHDYDPISARLNIETDGMVQFVKYYPQLLLENSKRLNLKYISSQLYLESIYSLDFKLIYMSLTLFFLAI